jgi:uncharacterized protein YqeY
MSNDAAAQMKSRLRADLVPAMKAGRKHEAALVRQLIAVLDNAEAAPDRNARASVVQHEFGSGSAEVDRLMLNKDQVRELLLAEIENREQAALQFERLSRTEAAHALRAEIVLTRRYID